VAHVLDHFRLFQFCRGLRPPCITLLFPVVFLIQDNIHSLVAASRIPRQCPLLFHFLDSSLSHLRVHKRLTTVYCGPSSQESAIVPDPPAVSPMTRSLPKGCAIAWPQQRPNRRPLAVYVMELHFAVQSLFFPLMSLNERACIYAGLLPSFVIAMVECRS
jgi:hypothetical protein